MGVFPTQNFPTEDVRRGNNIGAAETQSAMGKTLSYIKVLTYPQLGVLWVRNWFKITGGADAMSSLQSHLKVFLKEPG